MGFSKKRKKKKGKCVACVSISKEPKEEPLNGAQVANVYLCSFKTKKLVHNKVQIDKMNVKQSDI